MEHATKPHTATEGVAPFTFSEEAHAECRIIISRYPADHSKSALIPILHIAQAENNGWLSVPAMDAVAKLLKIQYIEVYEVATFYSMFNLHPMGKHVLEVCHTVPCMLRGADDVVAHIEKRLNIKPGGTTADGLFSLKTVECLGSCGTAPMLQCGAKYHEHLTTEKVDELIEKLRIEPKRNNYTDR
ncbi:MAG: NADH-quinone oxidoreductase subunit NuoE [Flavobacteriales bacterium]|jgi:NADH-quinone oxidoreductase subunit E|nr:NADH-quinone oxidoreductase subunit NuoE [Flavobacteriales bacterium]MBP9159520.1 NADH-quinone oxidoreductase subunit NuoE [Flavobacteriales bacterium]MCI1751676.1 NADH-quinone oxidoreductase subunit NuoE [Flavobacteriales bacterium]